EVVERTGDHIQRVVVTDVAGDRTPAVVGRAQTANGVPRGDLLRVRDDTHQVLPRKILEADLAGAADVQRDRAERRGVLLVERGRGRGTEGREHFIRAKGTGRTSRRRPLLANRDVHRVPFAGLQGR